MAGPARGPAGPGGPRSPLQQAAVPSVDPSEALGALNSLHQLLPQLHVALVRGQVDAVEATCKKECLMCVKRNVNITYNTYETDYCRSCCDVIISNDVIV